MVFSLWPFFKISYNLIHVDGPGVQKSDKKPRLNGQVGQMTRAFQLGRKRRRHRLRKEEFFNKVGLDFHREE